jgi:ribose 5-phosphate isomerase B
MPSEKRIIVGSDHAAAEVLAKLVAILEKDGWEVKNVTKVIDGRAEYPIAAHKVAHAVRQGEFPKGILMCGTGLGMSYTANRYRGIRAALCLTCEFAALAREHNDSNILVMPGRATIYEPHEKILETWLNTPFSGDSRHVDRIRLIEETIQ